LQAAATRVSQHVTTTLRGCCPTVPHKAAWGAAHRCCALHPLCFT
jgi:hypothetical protein